MDIVLNYIESRPEQQAQLMQYAFDYFTSFPNIFPKLRYGIPFYYQKSWVAYTSPQKHGGIEVVFLRGIELSMATELLAKNRVMVRGIEYRNLEEIDHNYLEMVWLEALDLDLNVKFVAPYQRKKAK